MKKLSRILSMQIYDAETEETYATAEPLFIPRIGERIIIDREFKTVDNVVWDYITYCVRVNIH